MARKDIQIRNIQDHYKMVAKKRKIKKLTFYP